MPSGKKVSLEDLDGVILKNEVGYSLNKLGVRIPINRVGLLKLIEGIDIEQHNNEYLEKLKEQLETFGEDGYNFLDFNKECIHRNGTEFSDKNMNAKGWQKMYHKSGKYIINPINRFTASTVDLEGYDRDGYKDGYNKEGLDRAGRDREGYYVATKFNDEGIHKETGTEYDPEGYNINGYSVDGYDRDGKNEKGKTIEELEGQKNQQRKNFLGLMNLAKGYATGEITIEDYLKNHKITLEELIDFAKKQNMDKETIIALYRKKGEYNKYKTKFSKADYFKNKTTINGIEITSEIVDKVLNYLKENDRYLSLKVVNEHIMAYVKGELTIEEKQEENKERGQEEKSYIDDTGVIHRPEGAIKKGDEVIECPFAIGNNVKNSANNIAKMKKFNEVNKGSLEIKAVYKEVESPTQNKKEGHGEEDHGEEGDGVR